MGMSKTSNARSDDGSGRQVRIHSIQLVFGLASIALVLVNGGCSRPIPTVVEAEQSPKLEEEVALRHPDDGVDQKGAVNEFQNRIRGTWVVSDDPRDALDTEAHPSLLIQELELEIRPAGVVRWKQRFPAETEPLQKFRNRWQVQTGTIREPIKPPPTRHSGGGLAASSVQFRGISLLRYNPNFGEYASTEIKDMRFSVYPQGLTLRVFTADGLQKSWRLRRGTGVGSGAEYTPEDLAAERKALLPRLTKGSGRSTLGGTWPEAATVERVYHSQWSKEGRQVQQPTAYIRGKAVVVRDWADLTQGRDTVLDLNAMLLLPSELRAVEANELGTVIRILANRVYIGTTETIVTRTGADGKTSITTSRVRKFRETWSLQIIDLQAGKMIADVPFEPRGLPSTMTVFGGGDKDSLVSGPADDEVKDYLHRLTRRPR